MSSESLSSHAIVLDQIKTKWTTLLKTTRGIDRGLAKGAVKLLYDALGLPAPSVYFMASPMAVFRRQDTLKSIRPFNSTQIYESLLIKRAELYETFESQVPEVLKKQVATELYCALRWQAQLGVGLQIGKGLAFAGYQSSFLSSPVFAGGQEAWWLSGYDFCEQARVFTLTQPLNYWLCANILCGLTCGWCFLYERMAFVCDRPEHIVFDANLKLHCADGPAIRWTDGTTLYAWHGLWAPKWIIMEKARLTSSAIVEEADRDIRRAMFEIWVHEEGLKS